MKNLNKKIVIVLVLFLLGFFKVFSWSKYTHIALTIKSIEHSEKLKNGLFDKLNFDQGNFAILKWGNDSKNISGWMEYGADVEDKAVALDAIWSRSNNHFHNPLKTFNEAGLTDFDIPFPRLPLSLILWAQDGSEQDYYPSWLGLEGNNSWAKIREYYYSALTAAEQLSREEYFAKMFKGLGHQIHLIQDSSVPDHVRNDSHWEKNLVGAKKYGSFRCIESWLEDDKNLHLIVPFSQVPLFPQVYFDHLGENNLVPIFHLVDYGVYNGTNPSNNMEQGLAEYTNANFVSEDTILTEGTDPDSIHYFPFPKYASTNLNSLNMPYIITAADGKQDYVTYLKKDKDGEFMEHFLKAGYMEKALRPNADQPPTEIYLRTLFLDELCHKDYASMLIPRAVGYSAALINYFFRGEIQISLPVSNPGIDPPQKEGIYSLCTNPAIGFDKISLMVRNVTENDEEMTNGKVTLVVSYRTCNGDPFVPNPPKPAEERKFISVDYQGEVSIPKDNPLRINFDLSANPLPFNAVDVTLTVVFKGNLGAELTNAVAIGFKDISEPTPIDLFNNTDKVCFGNSYVNYDDAALWAAVDVNPQNGKIDCLNNAEIDITRDRIKPLYISFNGQAAASTKYYFQYESGLELMPGAAPHRIFVLADDYPAKFNFSVLVHAQSLDNLECPRFYLNAVHALNPYTNKLQWVPPTDTIPGHYNSSHSSIGSFRGFPYFIIKYYENSAVPENSSCTMPSFGSTLYASETSKNNATGNTQIIVERPRKNLE